MRVAIKQAKMAHHRGDYAIGACIVDNNNKIVVQGGNRVKTKRDSTKHVELELLQYSVGMLDNHYLEGYTLYSTHAPCPMCLTAAVWSKISRVVYGVRQEDICRFTDLKANKKWRGVKIEPPEMYKFLDNCNPDMIIIGDFLRRECLKLFNLS